MNTAPIVSKVWSFCTTLRDDGVGYGDYLEQLTYLIFLKMADEYARPPYGRDVGIPAKYKWHSLKSKKGAELEGHYIALLREFGTRKGMLGQIFTKAQNKIQDPAKLYRLIDMVDDTEWVTMGADIKGDIYENLLERNAEDTKSGAGQYFTPRALICAMVECVRPEPGKLIADPACGTGGFFLAAYDFITNPENFKLDKKQKVFLKHEAFHGNEIVANTRRLCLMNMFLHNIGEIDGGAPISPNDSLVADAGERFDYVLANPPFGKKSSMSFTNEEGEQEKDELTCNRQDFWATTSNKQLNFVQHIRTMLKTTGRAAVVVPDNVLFEGGAGETIRKKLLDNTDLHTILRLPTGVFYAQGVKANVIFFDNHEASPSPWTKQVWFYDYRTNIHHTLKKKPMRFEDLADFVRCYNPGNRHKRKATWNEEKNPEGRWRSYNYDEELKVRDKTSLDIFWLKDKTFGRFLRDSERGRLSAMLKPGDGNEATEPIIGESSLSTWPKGSEWRKWDLHVHSPASEGYKGDYNQFVIQLGNADCDVIGINDYFSVAGYKEVMRRLEDPASATEGNKAYRESLERLRSRTLLPVVECRMTDVVIGKKSNTGQRINFHLVFDPAVSTDDIETFIKSLKVKDKSIGSRYGDTKFLLGDCSVDLHTSVSET